MDKAFLNLPVILFILLLIVAGSYKKKFHFAKFWLSITAVIFLPGLASAFFEGFHLLSVRNDIWMSVLLGSLAGIFLYKVIFRKMYGFSTFEHELSHALVALVFFRRIKKFVVTRHNGGYIEYSEGFGGNVGNYFISLGPYFLPTFTLFSVLIRPFLPDTWFPVYDFWIGVTFSYQMMNNVDEIRMNWTKKRFRSAGTAKYTETDIGKEGYIFSFIIILALKLFILSQLLFILVKGYSGIWENLEFIAEKSLVFYQYLW